MVRRAEFIKKSIQKESPELINLFDIYANEAMISRTLLDKNLKQLEPGAKILEVGGGILALATQLASEGYRIETVEPISGGFTEISYIMNKYLEVADYQNSGLNLIKSPIEECTFNENFDFIFSINVMEHLKDPYVTLENLVSLLNHNAVYRFICPNYDFPYEPHFGKILFSRKNNSFFLPEHRAKSKLIKSSEILGLYESVNFITLRKILRKCIDNNFSYKINTYAFYEILVRSIDDHMLTSRHRRFKLIVKIFSIFRIISIFKKFPPLIAPVCDIEVKK